MSLRRVKLITLAVNELIQDVETKITFRLLWIDEGNIIAYLIDIKSEKAIPFNMSIKEIIQGLNEGTYIKLEGVNSNLAFINIDISEKMLTHRDKAWGIIKNLIKDEPAIYINRERGPLIKKLVEDNICSNKTAYKYLRRYWQKGMTINSLIPEYSNSGGKNKSKQYKDSKNGRRRKNNSIGIIVSEEIKDIFKKTIKKYYFNDKKNSLTFAYKMMIKEHFAFEVRYENGVKHIVILDENSIPTIRQFRYWFKNEYSIEQSIKSRQGIKKFERDNRAILGSSSFETMGPGSRYQIDATTANVYLISSYNSDWIIGRPIIYFVVDVFTHMITGVYIGLEGPSWAGMMMAIANAVSDKKEFCSQNGIEISNEWWPSAHLPEIILGDRGELEGYNINSLISGLNVSIENTPSYRPDWKGIVEKLFDNSDVKIKPFLPGYIQTDFGERGAKDYRLQAKLTLEQYTKIIINFILYYNRNHYMKDYPRDDEMIEANVKPKPIDLWNWGIKNRAGKLRKVDSNTIKFYLLPKDKATITPKGIKFKGMLYSSETAIGEAWFVKARSYKTWKVDVSYDPRNMNTIYLHTKDEKIFEPCSLLDHQERYKDKIIEDIDELIKREKENLESNGHTQLQEEINLFSSIESIIKESIQTANKTQTKQISKSKKTGDIRVNRHFEKSQQRKKEAFNLSKQEKSNKGDIEDIIEFEKKTDNGVETKVPSIKELFNQRRQKNKH